MINDVKRRKNNVMIMAHEGASHIRDDLRKSHRASVVRYSELSIHTSYTSTFLPLHTHCHTQTILPLYSNPTVFLLSEAVFWKSVQNLP